VKIVGNLKGKIVLVFSFVFAASAVHVHAGKCGTPLLFQPGKQNLRASFKSGASKQSRQVDNRARTFQSEHFLIHYSLRGIHKVRTGSEDAELIKTTDSLFALVKLLPLVRQDSIVYAQLDAMKAPHPTYILKTRDYFESAWKYYISNLGMKAPSTNILSVQYNVASNLPRKFPVDIVDVGSADPDFSGETYAVTYPPAELSITFENDFLWDTKLDSLGIIQGKSIKSQVAGKVLHDYAIEWDLGLQVTAYHEFYHAIQFTYNPRVAAYHAWYEISAVGMEERNAPLVNDYFQYLPCVLKNHDRVSLTSMNQGPCSHAPMYGHGIFHIFLSQVLDSTFDVKVWDELSRNGDILPKALEFAFEKYGQNMDRLYRAYTGQLFFSGDEWHRPPKEFSPDMPLWTTLSKDSIDMSESTPYRMINLPALTFAVLKVSWNERAGFKVLQTKGIKGIIRIHANSDSSIVEQLDETQFALSVPRSGFTEYYLLIPNTSFTTPGSIEIREPEARFFAFPNPVRTTSPAQLYFSQPKEMVFPAQVEIYAENGVLVRKLNYASQDAVLVWDLKGDKAESLKPGIYYYRLEKETLRPLVLLR
jgi:hypothetical protein